MKLVKYRPLALVPLGYGDAGATCSSSQNCLERVEDATVSGTPFVNDVQVLARRSVCAHLIASTVHAGL
jgi:hypothetical protein